MPESSSGPRVLSPPCPVSLLLPDQRQGGPGEGKALRPWRRPCPCSEWEAKLGLPLQLCRHRTPSLCSSDLLCQAPPPRAVVPAIACPYAHFSFPASPASCQPKLKVPRAQHPLVLIPTLCNHLFPCLHSHTWGGTLSDSFVSLAPGPRSGRYRAGLIK